MFYGTIYLSERQLFYASSLLVLVMRLLRGGSDVRIFWTRCWGNDDLQSHAEEGV